MRNNKGEGGSLNDRKKKRWQGKRGGGEEVLGKSIRRHVGVGRNFIFGSKRNVRSRLGFGVWGGGDIDNTTRGRRRETQ